MDGVLHGAAGPPEKENQNSIASATQSPCHCVTVALNKIDAPAAFRPRRDELTKYANYKM
jgi:hypothetical protein